MENTPTSTAKHEKIQNERMGDIAISRLDTEGFDALDARDKRLAYHLSQAGLYGRAIAMDQGSRFNLELIAAMIELHEKAPAENRLKEVFRQDLFALFAHNGVYHSMSGQRLDPRSTADDLDEAKAFAPESARAVARIWLGGALPEFRTVQTEGVDGVAASGGNFYQDLTQTEVSKHRASIDVERFGGQVPPFGFNQRLSRAPDGSVVVEQVGVGGLYDPFVRGIVGHLEQAVEWAQNDAQRESISTLIDFYRSGSAEDFDRHCVAWTKDRDSSVYFINGLIESYDDPLGVSCSFESLVAFKNPEQTAKVGRVIENIQWFEDNLPIEQRFKKDKAQGLSASSITVVSMAGDAAPTLPLGVNLPNSDWIRREHGSKSVSLANVASARSGSEALMRQALYLPKYQDILERYLPLTNNLHTDLHEIAGHGSGKMMEGATGESLGAYYSVIEEARADLVALYFMPDPALKRFGVFELDVEQKDAAMAQYVGYVTGGAFAQLRRVDLGNDLTQAHFRNRQLIARWAIEHADPTKLAIVEKDGAAYVEINDIEHVRELFGQLLGQVQRIKSTGDFEGARDLVMGWGTKVDLDLHRQTLDRIAKLDLPKVQGFLTPELILGPDGSVELRQPADFLAQQIDLHERHVAAPLRATAPARSAKP
jgi:dipeptidyl-peptidase-3